MKCILCNVNEMSITSQDFCEQCYDSAEKKFGDFAYPLNLMKWEKSLRRKGIYYDELCGCYQHEKDRDPREVNKYGEIIC